MSKKLGRCKKFSNPEKMKLQQVIAEQAELNDLLKKHLYELSLRLQNKEAIVRRTAEVLGKFFMTLPAPMDTICDMAVSYQIPLFRHLAPQHVNNFCLDGLRFIETNRLEMQSHVEKLENMVHVSLKGFDGQWYYATTWDTILNFPEKDAIATICSALSDIMVKNIRAEHITFYR